MPDPFEQYRQERKNILYIGLASKSLRVRMWEQELHHKKPATFFRSLGTILGYEPEPLKNKSKNFRFSDFDTQEIIKWIKRNVEVCWICMPKEGLDNLETELIERYTPVINLDKNPKAPFRVKNTKKTVPFYS